MASGLGVNIQSGGAGVVDSLAASNVTVGSVAALAGASRSNNGEVKRAGCGAAAVSAEGSSELSAARCKLGALCQPWTGLFDCSSSPPKTLDEFKSSAATAALAGAAGRPAVSFM